MGLEVARAPTKAHADLRGGWGSRSEQRKYTPPGGAGQVWPPFRTTTLQGAIRG